VLARCRHPVTLVTKSALILRDMDLLADMARDNLVSVSLSVTSLQPEIKRTLEPRTASPQARLRVIRELSAAGVPTGVLIAPVIPAITDHEMEGILQAAKEAGALSAGYVLLRLPWEVKDLFREWLAEHYPDRARHVMSLINQARGGARQRSELRLTHARYGSVCRAAAGSLRGCDPQARSELGGRAARTRYWLVPAAAPADIAADARLRLIREGSGN
jgi:DNA repair photolyase